MLRFSLDRRKTSAGVLLPERGPSISISDRVVEFTFASLLSRGIQDSLNEKLSLINPAG